MRVDDLPGTLVLLQEIYYTPDIRAGLVLVDRDSSSMMRVG